VTLADVPGGTGLGPAQAGRDRHDRAVADLPIEQLAVKRSLPLGVECLDLPVHDGPRPIVAHDVSLRPSSGYPRSVHHGASASSLSPSRCDTKRSGSWNIQSWSIGLPSGAEATVNEAPSSRANRSPSPRERIESRFAHRTWDRRPAWAHTSLVPSRPLVKPHHAASMS